MMQRVTPMLFLSAALGSGCTQDELAVDPSADASEEPTAFTADGEVILASLHPPRCPVPVDAQAVASCQLQGAAALVQGVGYSTLASAVAATPAGGTVVVCPGTYPGPLTLTAPITVRAADPGPGATILDGQHARRALIASATVRVVGLTLVHGDALSEGGGGVVEGAQSELECLTVSANASGGDGGGLAIRAADVAIAHSSFYGNHAGYGGGAIITGETGTFSVTDSVFARNTSGYEGGAVSAPSDMRVERTVFSQNETDYGGGAMTWGARDPHQLRVIDSVFEGNYAGYEGGALDLGSWGADRVWISGTAFRENDADNDGGAITFGSWGRIEALIEGSEFSRNTADDAGAINLGGWLQQGGTIHVRHTDFRANEGSGGASILNVSRWAPSMALRLEHVRVAENVGAIAAFALRSGDAFSCTTCQFAVGAHDNLPADYAIGRVVETNAPPNFQY